MSREIDYVPEDNFIQGQRYALVSIVGPNMPQKCDTWAIKVRGVVDSIEQAKGLSKKIMSYDNDFDIFTAEVGKFFPLNVEPLEVGEVEYQNEQLNTLMKKYYENKEHSTQQWNERKREMMKEAVKDNTFTPSRDHAVVVLQRIKDHTDSIAKFTEELENARIQIQKSRELYLTYTSEERDEAEKLMNTSGDTLPDTLSVSGVEGSSSLSAEKLMNTSGDTLPDTLSGVEGSSSLSAASVSDIQEVVVSDLQNTLAKLRLTDEQILKLECAETLGSHSETLGSLLSKLKVERADLLSKLDTNSVNKYINTSGDTLPDTLPDTLSGVEGSSSLSAASVRDIQEVVVSDLQNTLAKLRLTDEQILKLECDETLGSHSETLGSLLSKLKVERADLLSKLDTNSVNKYINKNYQGSEHNYLLDNVKTSN
jgi:hypothetical protein